MEIDLCECDDIHEESVKTALELIPSDDILYELSDFFKSFSDSTRIKILFSLEKCELCVCDLATLLKVTKSAVSHQLKNLRQLKLVKCRRDGKNIFYSLDDEHVKDIIEIGLNHLMEK